MDRFTEAEEVLNRYPMGLEENREVILLFARILKAQDKQEALDVYARWLEASTDVTVRFEYAQLLEQHEFYARALEELQEILEDLKGTAGEPRKSDVRFSLAKALLIADPENEEGIKELETAITEGFNDIEALEELQQNTNLTSANRDSLRVIINDMQRREEQTQAQETQITEDSVLRTEMEGEEPVLETDPETGSE
jgi:hypothetical protein